MQLGDTEYTPTRSGLKKWLELENLKSKIFDAAGDSLGFAQGIINYLAVALCVSSTEIDEVAWYEAAEAYATINVLNNLNFQFPLLKESSHKEKYPWDYEGRSWYLWANVLAKAYGWSLEYIAELDPDDGVALLQEILTDDQLEKEWQWGLSEIAYPYNPDTKKSEFKEFARPVWMQKEIRKPVTHIRLPASMLPAGIVRHFKMDGSSETT